MILQLRENEKYETLKDKFTIVAEWQSVRQIQTTIPDVNVMELTQAIQTRNKYKGDWFVELRW